MDRRVLKMFMIGLVVSVLATVGVFIWTLTAPPSDMADTNADMLSLRKQRVVEDEVRYADGKRGLFVRPLAVGDYPGVILIHEWWGLNDGIKESARTLASEGYNVFAVDLFGKVAPTPDAARAQVGALDQAAALQNMTAAHTFLTEHGVKKIAVWGWCFGGGQAMQFSLSGKPLAATVIYYGNPVTDESRLQSIRWPVLGIFGQEDTSVKPESAVAFDQTLTSLGIEHEVKIYPNVGHAFANPSGPNYAPDETKDAWEKTLTFLDESLR